MSKAFTSEETPDDPIVVPPRAPLPADVPNYVTARGLTLLQAERTALEQERARVQQTDDDAERTRRLAVLGARLAALGARIAGAQVVDPRAQPHDEVRFGATVALRGEDGEVRRFQIVGVDEADAAHGRIAFTAPIARAVIGLRVGETAMLHAARGDEELEVTAIAYEVD